MSEIVVHIPDISVDEQTKSALKEDIRAVVRLRLARELLLKRLDKLLAESRLTEEECLLLGERVKDEVVVAWRRRGWL
jgi:hypothetical protein